MWMTLFLFLCAIAVSLLAIEEDIEDDSPYDGWWDERNKEDE